MASSEEKNFAPPPAPRSPAWPAAADGSSLVYVPAGLESDDGDAIGVTLSGIGSMLWRRKWTIGVIALPVFAAVAAKTLRTPKIYQSTVTVLVEQGDPRGDSALEVLEDVGRTNSPLETEARLITSQRVIEPVVRELFLHTVVVKDGKPFRPDEAFTAFRATVDAAPGEYSVERDDSGVVEVRDAVADTLVARAAAANGDHARLEFAGIELGVGKDNEGLGGTLRVGSFAERIPIVREQVRAGSVTMGANLLNITCESGDPRLAQRICDAVSRSYMQLRTEVQHAEAEAAAEFLAGQVEEVGKRLTAAEDSLGAYQERSLAVALDQRASSEVGQYASLELQREQLETERQALAALLREVDQAGDGGRSYRDLATFTGFARGSSPVVNKLMQSLIDLEGERSSLAVTRTDRNPDIIAIDARIVEIENQLRTFATRYESSLEGQVASLAQAMGRSQGQLSTIPARQVATSRLQRQVDLLHELYIFLQTRLREAEIARNVNLPGVQIVDTASLSKKPASPDVRANLLLGLLLGLGVGMVVALYREYTDSSLRDRKEVERRTGIPVRAMIPSVGSPGPILPVAGANGGHPGRLPGSPTSSGLPETQKPLRAILESKTWDQKVALEAFRSLLSDLTRAGTRDGSRPVRSVAVTSATRGDGKTFTACNLAIASAAQGRRTLLIDTDLRAGGVGRFFGLPWAPGLVEILHGKAEFRSALNDLEIAGDHGSLHVVASGDSNSPPGWVLDRYAQRLESMLGDLEGEYDMVVVDTPPLNVITDAASITARADSVLVVVRGGATDREALELTLKRLHWMDANIFGIVLNDVELPEYYTSYSHAEKRE